MVVNMPIDEEVRTHVYALLAGAQDFDTFEAWFVGETWDDRTALVAQVDHLMAEADESAELLESLRRLVSVVVVGEMLDSGDLSGPTIVEDVNLTRNQTLVRRLAFVGR
jgi:hypothetical protein